MAKINILYRDSSTKSNQGRPDSKRDTFKPEVNSSLAHSNTNDLQNEDDDSMKLVKFTTN